MKYLSVILIIGGFFISSISAAEGNITAGDITLIKLYQGHGGILIQHSNLADPDECGRADYFILPDTYPYFEEAYSLLLAAQMADKKVSFTVSNCHEGIPAIKHINLSKQ